MAVCESNEFVDIWIGKVVDSYNSDSRRYDLSITVAEKGRN